MASEQDFDVQRTEPTTDGFISDAIHKVRRVCWNKMVSSAPGTHPRPGLSSYKETGRNRAGFGGLGFNVPVRKQVRNQVLIELVSSPYHPDRRPRQGLRFKDVKVLKAGQGASSIMAQLEARTAGREDLRRRSLFAVAR